MTTKIELRRMTFYAYHGVAPQETRVGNTFIVDLILTDSSVGERGMERRFKRYDQLRHSI